MKSLVIGALFAVGTAFAGSGVPAGDYKVDSTHSKVGFEIPHLVISTVEGKFNIFGGSVSLAEPFSKSKVSASIDVASIDTGVQKRDDHLKSGDFFDVKKHPKMNFTSQKISGDSKKFKMTGPLSIKGKTKIVTFEGKYLGTVNDPYGNQKVAFEATTKINRKDFGLTWSSMVEAGPVVGDEVTITLKIQAARPLQRQAQK